MTAESMPADESQPETDPEAGPEATSSEDGNVNGGVVDSPTPNSHVVGVTILEGSGDPQAADDEG